MNKATEMKQIQTWTSEELIAELRSPIRASLGPDSYYLLFAEALARIMSNIQPGR